MTATATLFVDDVVVEFAKPRSLADVLTGPVVYRHLINGKPLTAKVLGSIVDQVLFGALPR